MQMERTKYAAEFKSEAVKQVTHQMMILQQIRQKKPSGKMSLFRSLNVNSSSKRELGNDFIARVLSYLNLDAGSRG